MDDDFGFVRRGPGGAAVVVSPSESSPMKNEHGKLTNGTKSGTKSRDDRNGSSHQLDQSLGELTVRSDDTADTITNTTTIENTEENNNSSKPAAVSENDDKMLKHIRSSSTSSSNSGNSAKIPNGSESKAEPGKRVTVSSPLVEKEKSKSPNTNSKEKESIGNPSKSPLSSDGMDNNVPLPQRFVVKYLGFRETTNLWGIKYTRRPVDEMVAEAKKMLSENTGKTLPLLKMEVTETGIQLDPMPQNNNPEFPAGKFAIEAISYGVQDLVFTRVFAMIVVKSALATAGNGEQSPHIRLSDFQKQRATGGGNGESSLFRCHAFVCDSRQTARKLTYSLATAFQKFSQCVAAGKVTFQKPKKFAIDLRSPEDIEADLIDSEA